MLKDTEPISFESNLDMLEHGSKSEFLTLPLRWFMQLAVEMPHGDDIKVMADLIKAEKRDFDVTMTGEEAARILSILRKTKEDE